MSKKCLCLILLLFLIFPAGCWDRQELNELAIVLAAGVDTAPGGNIKLTVQIARPRAFGGGAEKTGGQPKQNNVWLVSQTGRTILDAQRMMEKKVSRSIYWGHTVIIVFGEDIGREGLNKVINFFSRSPAVRETTWVFMARGTAEQILNSHSQLENTSAQAVGFMARAGISTPVMLKDLKIMLAGKGIDPVLPDIKLTPSGNPQGPGMKENVPAARGKQEQSTQVHAEITLDGTSVFKGDKLVGHMDIAETRGVLWLKNQMERGIITVPSLDNPEKKISIELTGAKTEVEPFWNGENISFEVNIKMEGNLLEQQSTEDLTNPRVFKAIQDKVARVIEVRIRQSLEKAQYEYETDIFGFGDALHRKYKKQWKGIKDRWNEVFTGVDIGITVDAHIRRTGLETKRAVKQ